MNLETDSPIQPPSRAEGEVRFTKGWLSPDGVFYPLEGLIHDHWAALALGAEIDPANPTGRFIDQLFRLGWVRVRPESGNVLKLHNDAFARLNLQQFLALQKLHAIHSDVRLIYQHRFEKHLLRTE